MKKYVLLNFALMLSFLSSAQELSNVPHTSITNGLIDASFYLPDAENGYYRGTRFDWSAVMPTLVYKGHSYFGKWFDTYRPTLHDAIMGPVEAFAPIGYEDAGPNETFLLIGIGMVRKEEAENYHFTNYYPIVNAGTWETTQESDNVTFIHNLEDSNYGYKYEKVVELTPDLPQMIIHHKLTNTGKKSLITNVYNHNFFVIDSQPTGPDFTVTFPFELSGDEGGVKGIGALSQNKVKFQRVVESGESFIYNPLRGYGDTAADYDIRIENRKTGAGVRITSDRPLSKLLCWSASRTICPEPYIAINVAHGATSEWSTIYDFYTLSDQ